MTTSAHELTPFSLDLTPVPVGPPPALMKHPPARRHNPRVWARQQQRFLRAVAQGCSITRACELAQMPRCRYYQLCEQGPEWPAAVEDALNQAIDAAEDELRRRAIDGYTKPVFQAGKQVGEIREWSDRLLLAYLARHRAAWRPRAEVGVALAVKSYGNLDLAEVLAPRGDDD